MILIIDSVSSFFQFNFYSLYRLFEKVSELSYAISFNPSATNIRNTECVAIEFFDGRCLYHQKERIKGTIRNIIFIPIFEVLRICNGYFVIVSTSHIASSLTTLSFLHVSPTTYFFTLSNSLMFRSISQTCNMQLILFPFSISLFPPTLIFIVISTLSLRATSSKSQFPLHSLHFHPSPSLPFILISTPLSTHFFMARK